MLEAREDFGVVDYAHPFCPGRVYEPPHQRRHLSVCDDVDAPDPRRMAQDRGYAIFDLVGAVEARGVRGGGSHGAALAQERVETLLVGRVTAVDPGDHGIDGVHENGDRGQIQTATIVLQMLQT
jgi:hypothetical protein